MVTLDTNVEINKNNCMESLIKIKKILEERDNLQDLIIINFKRLK